MNIKPKHILIIGALSLLLSASLAYNYMFKSNVQAPEGDYFFIRSTDNYEQVLSNLVEEGIILNEQSFDLIANKMKLPQKIKGGKYLIKSGLSNVEIVRLLRSGKWENQVIKLKSEMTRESVLNYLASQLEANRKGLDTAMQADWLMDDGFTDENKWCIFLPDHYYFNWASTAEEVVKRFHDEYKKYWSKGRLSKAYNQDLSAEEACILASIVDGEAVHSSEMPTIAGLYLNRLKIDMPLQADPTILYIIGREGRNRVYFRDLKTQHPYNTYLNKGLPPGPIMLADKRAIEAVLAPEKHNYLYMVAKEDGSYYHYFASNYAQHQVYASRYRRKMNRLERQNNK